ncbi:MAG: glycosyltransferase [Candidatus Bathyarchaeales archaeon]
MLSKVDVVIPTSRTVNSALLNTLHKADWVANIYITREKPLSVARKNAVLRANTEWVAMFDDDVVIPSDWYWKVAKYVSNDIGAVATVAQQGDRDYAAYDRIVDAVYGLRRVETSPHINNVLIRRSLMENYDPPMLFLGEDQFLKKYVESHNYKWLVLDNIGVVHFGAVKSKVDVGIAYRRYAHYSLYQLARRFFARMIIVPFAAAANLSFKTLIKLSAENVQFISGWLKETVSKKG